MVVPACRGACLSCRIKLAAAVVAVVDPWRYSPFEFLPQGEDGQIADTSKAADAVKACLQELYEFY